jgi:hypothetical protein
MSAAWSQTLLDNMYVIAAQANRISQDHPCGMTTALQITPANMINSSRSCSPRHHDVLFPKLKVVQTIEFDTRRSH